MKDSHLSCSNTDIVAALADAEAICDAKGARLTPIRRRVLELLLTSHAPAKAYDLLADLKPEGAAKPPTIYRALDFLLEMGLAHKIESLDAFVACGHRTHQHRAMFLICDRCGGAQELHSHETFIALEDEVGRVAFQPKNIVIEIHGLCATCLDQTSEQAS